MSNRVAESIARVRTRLVELDAAAIAKLNAGNALEGLEHHAYQTMQSQAFAAGRITFEEAQACYVALGEIGSSHNGGWADGTDLATKIVVTSLVAELMGVRA